MIENSYNEGNKKEINSLWENRLSKKRIASINSQLNYEKNGLGMKFTIGYLL
jgi:hypothetical protein